MKGLKMPSRTISWFLTILFLGITCTSATFTRAVTRFAKVIGIPNTSLGIYSRSSSVAALSLLEQEKLKEAEETLAQTALTLAVLDIGGGAVLPVVEEIVTYIRKEKNFAPTRQAFTNLKKVLNDEVTKSVATDIDKNAIQRAKEAVKKALKIDVKKFPALSKVSKAFTRASKWLKGASVFDVLGPLADSLTIGINIWGLKIAIEDGNAPGIAAASLSIAAGVVGLTTFVAAIVTGSAVLGPVGAIIGAVLGIAATLVELFGGSSSYDKAAVEAYRNRLRQLRNLRDACRNRIDQKMAFMDKVGSPYTDVYVNNQVASMTAISWSRLKMESSKKGSVKTTTGLSLNQRKYVTKRTWVAEICGSSYLCMGHYSAILSPRMPIASSHTGWGKEAGEVGFDFYGKFKNGTTYKGVHVFVDSDFVNLEPLNDIEINTEPFVPNTNEMFDVVSIGDYKKIKSHSTRPAVKIMTGGGNDVLNINGMIGEFQSDSVNVLEADLGDGHNVLSFQGMTKDRNDTKGIFFDSKPGILKYFHGTNRDTHLLGTVKNVELLNGSPFDDHVILYPIYPDAYNIPHFNLFIVVQQRGKNTYEVSCDDLASLAKEHALVCPLPGSFEHNRNHVPWFQIIDKSNQTPKVNLKTTSASNIQANDVVIFKKKLVVFDTTGQEPVPIFQLMLETETTGNLFINNANPRPIIPGYISPVLITGEIKVFERPGYYISFTDGDESNLLFLKWDVDTMGQPPGKMNFVDMKGGTNYVLISEKDLIEPLGIDGSSITLTVKRAPRPLPDNPLHGKCFFPIDIMIASSDFDYGYFWELCNVEKIINEYGDELVASVQKEIIDDSPYPGLDLYNRYIEVTRETLLKEK